MIRERRRVIIPGLAVFALALAVYIVTLCPSVYTGDSGEFITASYVMGISHPPGYPLYSLLGKFFTLLPISSIAWRVNLMSAFFAALTAMLVYFLVYELTDERIPSVVSGISLAFTYTLWSQAVTAEVYTLNAFFMALTFYLILQWRKDKNIKWIYLLVFLTGLSMANHYIMALFIPAYLYFIWAVVRESGYSIFKYLKRKWFIIAGFFMMGFVFYVFLMIRSSANPPIDWGNTEKLSNFLNHIRRVQYKAMEFGAKAVLLIKLNFLWHFMKQALKQFTVLIIWLGALGLWRLFRKDRKLFVTTLLIFVFNSAGLIFLLNFPYESQARFIVEVYYIPAYIILAVWIGLGLKWLAGRMGKTALVLLLIPCIPFVFNLKESNRADYHIGYDYGMNILNTLERDSIYFCSGDNQMFILAYLKMAEGKRPDVTVYTDTGFVFENIYGPESIYLPNRNVRNRVQKEILRKAGVPVYFALGSNISNFPSIAYEPCGIVYRYMRDGDRVNNEMIWQEYSLRGIDDESVFKDYLNRGIACQYYYFRGEKGLIEGNREEAKEEYKKAIKTGYDIDWVQNNIAAVYNTRGMHDDVIDLSKLVLEHDSQSSDAYSNIGFALSRKEQYGAAIKAMKKSISLKPGNESAYMKIAGIYVSMKDSDNAMSSYREALKINPKSSNAYLGIGGIYFKGNRYDEALDFYMRAVVVDEYSSDAYNNVGVVYERKKMYKEAIESYTIAAGLSPGKPDARYNLGVVYWKMGEWGLVVKEFEEALRIDPGYEKAKRFLPKARMNAGKDTHESSGNRK